MYAKNSARGRSASCENSSPSTRSASNESDSSKSSVNYAERMKAKSWAYQMEVEDDIRSFSLAAEASQGNSMAIDAKTKSEDHGTNGLNFLE